MCSLCCVYRSGDLSVCVVFINQVIKSVCCVSVVRDYILFRKFNLHEVVKDDAGPNPGSKTSPAAAAAASSDTGPEPSETKGTSAGAEAAGPRTEATGNGNTEGDLKNATPAE